MSKRKVITFLRVSTDAQDTARQKADVARVVAANNLEVLRTLELIDVSGRTVLANKDVQAMLKDLKRADVAGIAVSALDRLFRPNQFSDFSILDSFRDTGKLIFSAKEGALDPASDVGFMMSLMSGAQAGMEWRELRRRTMGGKAEKRKLGRNVNGPATLPRGLGYERITDASRRTIGHRWFYEEPDASRIRMAYDLLFAGRSYQAMARKIGGGWSRMGLLKTLANPVWMGVRRYEPDEQGNVLKVTLGIEPLISPARWQAAQQLIRERHSSWTKLEREPRFLATGLLFCECGKKCYNHNDPRRGQHDTYYCSTRVRGGGCRRRSLRRELVDAAAEQIVCEYMTSPGFLKRLLSQVSQPPNPVDTGGREGELAKLAAKRERLIDAYGEGHITKADFTTRIDAVAEAVREIETQTPTVASPQIDERRLVSALARMFAPSRFSKLPFAERRTRLRQVIRRFSVVDEAIPEFTVSGAFLSEFAHTNLSPHSTA